MNKDRVRWVMLVTLLLLTLGGLRAAAGGTPERQAITLCYEDQDVRPWRYRNGGGLNFQLLEYAARQTGVNLRYEAATWKRCLALLRDNQVDGVFAASYKPDRQALGVFPGGALPDSTKRLHVDRYVLLRNKGAPLNWDGRSLTRLTGPIGIQSGYSIAEQLRELGAAVDDGAASAIDLVRKLAAGRVGGAALLAGEASRVLANDPALRASVEVMAVPLVEKPYYLVLSHAFVRLQPQRAADLWQAIMATRLSAAYQILERRTLAALGQQGQ